MLNFASLFNQWRTQNNSSVLDILLQPNLNMGRLLDQESFQGEYKSGSGKIVQFMTYERFQELIEFVTVVGPADDKKRSFKYPLAACQVLSIQNNTALDFILPEKSIIIEDKIEETVQVQVEVQVEASPEENKEDTPEKVESPKAKEQTATENKTEQVKEEKPQEPNGENDVQILQEPPAEEESKPQELKPEQESPVKPDEDELEVQTPKKAMKKVLKKQMRTVERIEKREVPALIHKLLAYFQGQINYTLAGYVAKILSVLLNKRPNELMKYVLEGKMMHKIIDHAQSRSVGEFILKVITHESTVMLEQRRTFFKELLDRTSVSSDIEVISNLSSYLCQIIQKVAANLKSNTKIQQFNTTFFSLDIITQVIKNVMTDEQNVSVYNAPILLAYLTNVPFVLPDDLNIVNEFVKLGELFIEKSCGKLKVDKRSRPKLGTGRMRIVEILRFIIKEDVLNSKQTVAKTDNFFPILLNLVRQYGMNNMLHNEVIRILQVALVEPEDSALNQAVLKDDVLLKFISEEWDQDKKIKAGDSVYKFRKGYIAHIINLCIRLRELGQTNSKIKELVDGEVFTNVFQSSVEKEIFNTKKTLAGLMKKELKHQILFQKEDILASHMTFLQKCPTSVFEPQAVPINIDSPDLVEELQRQLEENMHIKTGTSQESIQSLIGESSSETKKAEYIDNEGRFWSSHLNYDIDDLMADL